VSVICYSSFLSESLVSLLHGSLLDTLAGQEGDDGLLALSNDEEVAGPGGEGVASGVLDVGDVEATGVLLDVLEDTDSADVVSASDGDCGSVLEFNEAVDLSSLKIQLDCVVLLDIGVGEPEGPAVVGNNIGDLVSTHGLASDLAELEGGFFCINLVGLVSSLDIVKNTEELSSFLNSDNVHHA